MLRGKIPASLIPRGGLTLPLVAAPMFLASGPRLVIETCRAGVIGTFPALNQRTSEGYETWLKEIKGALAASPDSAPFGVNLIVHKSNARLQDDLAITVRATSVAFAQQRLTYRRVGAASRAARDHKPRRRERARRLCARLRWRRVSRRDQRKAR